MNELLDPNYSIQSYIDENRTKIDESLVSLRLMKEIDDFLIINDLSQREFAQSLGCSEAYISQLMSGTKKFNTSFINKFEKYYDLEIDFKIKQKQIEDYFSEFSGSSINISINIIAHAPTRAVYSLQNSYKDYYEFSSDLCKLELYGKK